MVPKLPLKIGTLLGQIDADFQRLVTSSTKLYTLQKLVRLHLPPNLASHCHLANYKEYTLLLHADSPAWANRIRLESLQLQQKISNFQEFRGIRRIVIHVNKDQPVVSREPVKLRISSRSGAIINELAESINIPDLAKALKRLARRAQTP